MDMIRMFLEAYFHNGLQSGMVEEVEDYIKENFPEDKASRMVDALYIIFLTDRMPTTSEGTREYYFSNLPPNPNIQLSSYPWKLKFTKKVSNYFYSPFFKCPVDALVWAFEMLSDV